MDKQIHDLVIVGAGPSALTAAVYTTRENIETILFEKGMVGGLVATIDKIENYPGFSEGIDGMTLAEEFEKQARRFGAKIEYGEVIGLKTDGETKIIKTDAGDIRSRAVLIATGSEHKHLGVPGEEEYYGRGVHYCATCDGAFYVGKKLVVIGGGNAAIQEAMYLTKFASHVDILVVRKMRASKVLQDEMQKYIDSGKITVHIGARPIEFVGENNHITLVRYEQNDKKLEVKTDGIFIFVGMSPNTSFLKDSGVELDESGFVVTDNKLETAIHGVFASGDVRSGATMQVASAAGEGTVAALNISEYLK